MTRCPRWVWLLGCCALCGCGSSAPVRYFTLSDITSSVPPVASPNPVPILLEPIAIPQELDRLEIVSRIGPNRVRIAELDLWAAPLEDQIRRVLSDDLATRVPAHALVDPSEPAGSGQRRLSVSISEFLADESCSVTLRADWTLRGPDVRDQQGSERILVPGNGSCLGPAAAQMSDALAVLADRLAAMIFSTGKTAPAVSVDQRLD
jgi:uncharacterized protein